MTSVSNAWVQKELPASILWAWLCFVLSVSNQKTAPGDQHFIYFFIWKASEEKIHYMGYLDCLFILACVKVPIDLTMTQMRPRQSPQAWT